MKIRLNEAFKQAEEKGLKVSKTELARRLWQDSDVITARVNITNITSGRTQRITVEQVKEICDYLQCDANFLFDI